MSERERQAAFPVAVVIEMLLPGVQPSGADVIRHARIPRQVPTFIDLDRERQTSLEIAIGHEVLACRRQLAGLDRFGNVWIFLEVPSSSTSITESTARIMSRNSSCDA